MTYDPMNILVVGGGGREHALAWKAAQSPLARHVFVAPGNAGTAREPRLCNVPIPAEDIDGLLQFAQEQAIGLTIIGPEAPLVKGIVDRFQAAGLRCFGPSAGAAQLEGSKAFTKHFLARHRIPTAAYGHFTDLSEALAYLDAVTYPQVIKADGLAAGKGVIIATDRALAETTVRDMLEGNRFGEAGHAVVIEDFLSGEELSYIVISDGDQVVPMASSQDHKARDDGDQGPNTGGMGAYSPAPLATPELCARILREVIQPTVAGMAAEGYRYVGFLYAGLMVDTDGHPRVLEYNCRFGDPETQPILMRLNSDLVELCLLALDGRLHEARVRWDERVALGVVMAAGGYPDDYARGHPIIGLDQAETPAVKVFHAGTREVDGQVQTHGGRVLCVTALGQDATQAQATAYAAVARIHWTDACYRSDIGYRAVARERTTAH